MRRLLGMVLGLSALAGCAVLEPAPVVPPRASPLAEAFHLTGRVSVRYGNEGFSGNLDWQHNAVRDEFVLLTPLGQGAARIVRDESGVTLEVPDQPLRQAADPESLTQDALGFPLPLSGLAYWVQAQGRPGANIEYDEEGYVAKLADQGWRIDYFNFQNQGAYLLPGKVFMESGDIKLKLVIDEWRLP